MNSSIKNLDEKIIAQLRMIFATNELLLEPSDRIVYGCDNSRLEAMPDAVVLPRNTHQVRDLVRVCIAHQINLIARGRGTNTTGAVVPIHGGIVCSFERMRAILEINIKDRYAIVEPGVINGELQDALRQLGFFWPPDPTSSAYCTIAGNLACNAGGPRAVKYGACRENVLGLEAVTGRGDIIHTGTYTSKGAVGYDLTRLLIGSEGTLAMITRATLKLTPLPSSIATMCARFIDVESASLAVARVMAQAVIPCALEFMDRASINLAREYGGAEIELETGALLLIEVDGSESQLTDALDAIQKACQGVGLLQCERALDPQTSARLWAARKALSPAQRHVAPDKINEDVVVPVSRLPELVQFVEQLRIELGIHVICFGHAGNGNVHVNFLYDRSDAKQSRAAESGMYQLFEKVIALKGTLSGEHGIGISKRQFMSNAIDPPTLQMMRAIKIQFDPKCILNPGKLLPDLI